MFSELVLRYFILRISIQTSLFRIRRAIGLYYCGDYGEYDVLARINEIGRHGNSLRRRHSRVSSSGVYSLALRLFVYLNPLFLICLPSLLLFSSVLIPSLNGTV